MDKFELHKRPANDIKPEDLDELKEAFQQEVGVNHFAPEIEEAWVKCVTKPDLHVWRQAVQGSDIHRIK